MGTDESQCGVLNESLCKFRYNDHQIPDQWTIHLVLSGGCGLKILMVISYFIPEIGSAAHIYHDLAKGFIARGHEVSVITSYPRKYNLSEEDANKVFPLEEKIDGITIYRVENKVDRDNIFSRGLEHFLLPGKFLKVFKRTKQDFDVCLIYIPPLPLYKFASKIKKIAGIPSVLNFQDFHPQELTDVGVLKNPIIIKIMERMEREAYSKADHCVALTPGGVDYIIERGGNPQKVSHIYNAVSDEHISDCAADFKEKQSIQDCFLVTYAGILSPFQGIDTILDAAKLINNPKIIFYIIGDGIIKNKINERIISEKISNVVLLPLQPRDEYYNIICSSDVSIISLDERMKAPCFPGKAINLLMANVPIIAIVPECETRKIIGSSRSGVIVNPYDIGKLASSIIELTNDLTAIESMKHNSEIFFQNNFNIDSCIIRYEIIFYSLHKETNINCIGESL